MASAFRFGAISLLSRNSVVGLCKPTLTSGTNVAKVQVALISGRALRSTERKRPPPYPYQTKAYNIWNAWFDDTTYRMDDNSKIIVVDGPIAVGKTKLAEALATELDMLYMPAVTMDAEYINEYGFDMRTLDSKLPKSCQSYDHVNFCKEPRHENCAAYQILMYYHRYSQYIDALAHLFSTGQGIVLERSVYSDIVFMEAMHNAGYISKAARTTYLDLQANTLRELRLPHLVIYLDASADTVKEKIQKRGFSYEVESKVFTPEYLGDIEKMYKQQFLKEMARHSNILIYDWTDGGDPEVVVEDIERLSFDDSDKRSTKFKDWQFWDETDWNENRRIYADQKQRLLTNFNTGDNEAPELTINGHDSKVLFEVWQNAPGNKYMKGYNPDMGDKGLFWKLDKNDRAYRTKCIR